MSNLRELFECYLEKKCLVLDNNKFLEYYPARFSNYEYSYNTYLKMYQRYQDNDDILSNGILCWYKDIEEGDFLGPRFSVYIGYLENTLHDELNLPEEWMKEAAIRDLILLKYF